MMAEQWTLFTIVLFFILLQILKVWKEREKRYENEVTRLKRLVKIEKYVEALDFLEENPTLVSRYKLSDAQKRELLEIELYCLKKIGRIEDAVVALGMHLSMFYPIGEWDKELFERWISLYKSSPPIKAEKFNFTARVGVHPRTNALIKYAIDEKDCTPPIGFSGMMNVVVLKEFGKRKGIYSEKKNLKKKRRIIATPQVWKSEKWKYEIKFPANWHPIARYDQSIQSPNADVFCENSKGSSAVVFVVEHRDSRTLAEIEADLLKGMADNYRGLFGDITRISGKEYIQNGITYRRFTYSMGGFIHRYILALHNSCEYAISLTCPEAHFIKAEKDFDYIANSLKFLSGTISGSKRKKGSGHPAEDLRYRGLELQRSGDYKSAMELYKKALALYRQKKRSQDDKVGESAVLNNMGQIYNKYGDHKLGIQYSKEALKIIEETGDKSLERGLLNNIAFMYLTNGDNSNALRYLYRILSMDRKRKSREGEGDIVAKIAMTYENLGDSEKALAFYEQSLDIFTELKDKDRICFALLNVGELYAEKEQWEEAFSAWATLYKIARNSNNTKYLQELEKLASELNMPPGKEVWKELAQKYYQ